MLQIIRTLILRNKKVVFLTLILGMISCSDKTEFTQYKSLKNSSWKANEKIIFQFEVKDTISPKNLFINIRNNKDYPFSNLYLITELNFPEGTKIIDTLQYEMTNKKGEYLGKGFTDIKENKLFYKENKIFTEPGKYILDIRQAMRKNGEVKPIPFLKGILDVGFSIEKIE